MRLPAQSPAAVPAPGAGTLRIRLCAVAFQPSPRQVNGREKQIRWAGRAEQRCRLQQRVKRNAAGREQNRALSPCGQCLMCAHRRQIRALLDGRRQTNRLAMGAMRRINEQRHAVCMTNLRQLGDILQNTIVVRLVTKTADACGFCLSACSTSCASSSPGMPSSGSGTTNTGVKSSSAIACVTDL